MESRDLVSVSNVSGLVLVSVFGFDLELLVSRLCMSYFFMKSCKKQLLNAGLKSQLLRISQRKRTIS